jgi:hypothetical protein
MPKGVSEALSGPKGNTMLHDFSRLKDYPAIAAEGVELHLRTAPIRPSRWKTGKLLFWP